MKVRSCSAAVIIVVIVASCISLATLAAVPEVIINSGPNFRLSSNGQFAAEVPVDSVDPTINLRNVITNSSVKIESIGHLGAPRVVLPSNDGNFILFSVHDPHTGDCSVGVYNLRLMQTFSLAESIGAGGGGGASHCEPVSLSPDARMAAFVDGSGTLRLARLDPVGRLESLMDDRTLAHLSGIAQYYLVAASTLVAFDTPASIDFEDRFYHRDVYVYDRATDRLVWMSNFPERTQFTDCDLAHGGALSPISGLNMVFSCWQNENHRLFYVRLNGPTPATALPVEQKRPLWAVSISDDVPAVLTLVTGPDYHVERLEVPSVSSTTVELDISFLALAHTNSTPSNNTTTIGGSPLSGGIQPGAIAALVITSTLLAVIGIMLFLSTWKNGVLLASKADPPTASAMPMSPGPIKVYEGDSSDSDYSYEDAVGENNKKNEQYDEYGDDDADFEMYRHRGSEDIADHEHDEDAVSTTARSRPSPIAEKSDESNSEWEPPPAAARPSFQPFTFNRRNTPREIPVEVPPDAFVKKRKSKYRAQRELSVVSEMPETTTHSSLRNLKAPPGSDHDRVLKYHKSDGSIVTKKVKEHDNNKPKKRPISKDQKTPGSEPTTPVVQGTKEKSETVRSNQSAEAAVPIQRSTSKEKNATATTTSADTMQRSSSRDSKMLKIHLPHKRSKKHNSPRGGTESHREASSSRTTSHSSPKTSRSDGAIPRSARAPPSSSRSSTGSRTPTKHRDNPRGAPSDLPSDSDSSL